LLSLLRPTISHSIWLLLATIIFASSAAEAKGVLASVAAPELAIHSGPSGETPVFGKVQAGGFVMVMEIKGDWARVFWMKEKKTQEGWALVQGLRSVAGSGGAGDTFTTSGGATFNLSVNDVDLDCSESIDGGYSNCTATVPISYDSDYNGNDTPNVHVECEVELRTTDVKKWTSSTSDSESADYYGESESGEIEIDFSFSSFVPIIRVEVSDSSCQITDVY
jgi:hypothetical protein